MLLDNLNIDIMWIRLENILLIGKIEVYNKLNQKISLKALGY